MHADSSNTMTTHGRFVGLYRVVTLFECDLACSRFNKTLTCDRQTDEYRHAETAYTTLAVKIMDWK